MGILRLLNFQSIKNRKIVRSRDDSDANLCYINSTIQILFSIENFKSNILEAGNMAVIFNPINKELANIFICGNHGEVTSSKKLRR